MKSSLTLNCFRRVSSS